jgi:hypothetical protein
MPDVQFAKNNDSLAPTRSPDLGDFDPDRILEVLDRHHVDYPLIGAVAARRYGATRATYDVDCIPERSSANLERLAGALRELNSRLRMLGDPGAEALTVPLDATMLGRMELATWGTTAMPSPNSKHSPTMRSRASTPERASTTNPFPSDVHRSRRRAATPVSADRSRFGRSCGGVGLLTRTLRTWLEFSRLPEDGSRSPGPVPMAMRDEQTNEVHPRWRGNLDDRADRNSDSGRDERQPVREGRLGDAVQHRRFRARGWAERQRPRRHHLPRRAGCRRQAGERARQQCVRRTQGDLPDQDPGQQQVRRHLGPALPCALRPARTARHAHRPVPRRRARHRPVPRRRARHRPAPRRRARHRPAPHRPLRHRPARRRPAPRRPAPRRPAPRRPAPHRQRWSSRSSRSAC